MCAVVHKTDTPNPFLSALDYVIDGIEGGTFAEWLAQRRAAGDSYRTIAGDLDHLTNGRIVVSREAIRRYCNELDIEKDAS